MSVATNRIQRITFAVGPTKTSCHIVHPSGPDARYAEVRPDTQDAKNVQVVPRNRYITEET